jgi:penicillin-binding protein 1C
MRNRLAKYLVVVAALSITIGILDRMFPPDQSRYREASLEILARDGEPLRVFTTRDGMLRLATLPDDVDPRYLNLLLQVEDRHFWRHPGVDPLALARAVWQLIRQGRCVRRLDIDNAGCQIALSAPTRCRWQANRHCPSYAA